MVSSLDLDMLTIGAPAIKKAVVALVGGFGIQANNLW